MESDESDHYLAGSCTIKDMIEQSSGSGSGLPLLVRICFVLLGDCHCDHCHQEAFTSVCMSCLGTFVCYTECSRLCVLLTWYHVILVDICAWGWWSGAEVSALASINQVNLRLARLVLRWATLSGFSSRCWIFISVYICNQPASHGQLSLPSLRVGKWVLASAGKAKAGVVHSING